jgi:hypothetical protein
METSGNSDRADAEAYHTLKQKLMRQGVITAIAALDENLTLNDLLDDRLFANVVIQVSYRLSTDYGLDYDSLDILEALAPEDSNEPGNEGGTGVREPRRPVKPSDLGGIALETP